MSAVETGQMSAAETRQMSSAETRQMSSSKTGRCTVPLFYICLVSAKDFCPVLTADICAVSTEDVCPCQKAVQIVGRAQNPYIKENDPNWVENGRQVLRIHPNGSHGRSQASGTGPVAPNPTTNPKSLHGTPSTKSEEPGYKIDTAIFLLPWYL